VATFVLPTGATPTTVVESGATGTLPPGPTTVAQHRFDAPGLAVPLDVVQRLIEVQPGAVVPMHSHPGPTVVSGIQGSGTLAFGSVPQNARAGESWVEPANEVHGGTFTGPGPIRIVATTLLPRGAADTIPAAQPVAPAAPAATTPAARPPAQMPSQLPRTGGVAAVGLAAAVLGLGLLAGGVALRRPRS
jgi:quercetin dioxygenase-like cupin family protein